MPVSFPALLLKQGCRLVACLFLLLPAAHVLLAAEAPTAEWLTPLVHGYGAVRHYPDAAQQLDPQRTYQVLFDITAAGTVEEVLPGLETVARFLNLAALADVPVESLQLVAVVHGAATDGVLGNAAFRQRYRQDNVNLPLLARLHELGVTLYVCGQALAHQGLDPNGVTEEVEVAVAALTVLANYQLQGYALVSD